MPRISRRGGGFTVVDLFSGAGGGTRGFHEAGFRTLAAVEGYRPIAETFTKNFPKVEVICDDFKRVDPATLPSCDVVLASPPCEPFTAANAKRYADPLDRLYKDRVGGLVFHTIRAVKAVAPRVFVMENVPGIAEGALVPELRRLFRSAGYPRIHFNRIACEEHGLPSRRNRIFVSNVKLDLPRVERPPTAWEAISDLESLEADVPNHEELTMSRRERGRVEGLGTGDSIYHYRSATGKVLGHKTRIRADEPAPTVMGSSRFLHPFQDRYLTVREHARLMSFPDEHVFLGGRNVQYDEAGEAVPPLVARQIGDQVRDAIEGSLRVVG
ncbi:MAG TPA: DNA cytosine methyltransferase [Candidatus Thermoplasmatota archaeon]|nr:DNA cytosine methyltransferase [Candidatus Thermoplasmatota archaeon]